MGKKPHAKKVPKFDPRNKPNPVKEPKSIESIDGFTHPVWRLAHIDWDGPWCPSKCQETGIREVHRWLTNMESMSWRDIFAKGSHMVGVDGIVKDAKRRIIELGKEEWADNLCSLRKSGKERLWGFYRSGIFHVLWWDPEHQVYPSQKKHT